jgi:Fe-S-cluster-containing hydrogenase component 2
MRKIIIADARKCNGCGICELICSSSKEGLFNRRLSRIRVVNIEPLIDMGVTCLFCEDPACIKACPRGALYRRNDSVVTVDEAKCNGCSWCIEACDFGAITLHPNGTVVLCDLCEGKPKCIDWCPAKALQLATPDLISQKSRVSSIKRMARARNIENGWVGRLDQIHCS